MGLDEGKYSVLEGRQNVRYTPPVLDYPIESDNDGEGEIAQEKVDMLKKDFRSFENFGSLLFVNYRTIFRKTVCRIPPLR